MASSALEEAFKAEVALYAIKVDVEVSLLEVLFDVLDKPTMLDQNPSVQVSF